MSELKKEDTSLENEDLDEETFGVGLLEASSQSAEDDLICNICSNKLSSPRVLSCLHVYCELCLDKLLIDETGDPKQKDNVIKCPECNQETKIGNKNASCLPIDYVMSNLLDMVCVESLSVLCTSCKSSEKAISRCGDCGNFLCPNCNTAHEVMRCFENHHVVTLEELKKMTTPIPIHKPVLCLQHPNEQVKFYCYPCQASACSECIGEHKAADHHHERLAEAEIKQREELKNLIKESKSRVLFCDDASNTLGNALSELQTQRDNAKDLINETFQSYKAVLESRRDELLQDLKQLHTARELEIMELFHSVEKTGSRMEDACKFSTRLLELGNGAEILTLRKVVGTQLLKLINNTPKPDVNVSLDFETDINQFTQVVKDNFGNFKSLTSATPEANVIVTDAANPLSLTLSNFVNMSNIVGMNMSSMSTMSNGSSPVSLPSSSLQSSLEGDIGVPSTTFNLPPVVLGDISPVPHSQMGNSASLHGLTSMGEYNLSCLASLAEKTELDVPPASSTNSSPTPNFFLSEFLVGDPSSTNNAINNIQALAKLRLNSQSDIQDVSNGGLNGNQSVGNGLMLGRGGTSPQLDTVSNGTLTLAPINGFHNLSTPTSPILHTPDINGWSGQQLNNYPNPRSTGANVNIMQIRTKFGQLGPNKSQFNSPHGFCLGSDEDIIVADTNNHRVQVFEKNGGFKFQFGVPGKEEGQLWYPRKVAVMRTSGKFVVCDRGNERSRMQIFSKNGHYIRKIAIRYIDIVAGLAVTAQGHIVAVDSVSPTVFVISEGGDLVRWFDASEYMREPSDIAINGKEYYVCDFKGHCVVVFSEDGAFLRRIGCEAVTNFPNGIDVSDAGDVLVGDSHGNRFHVAVFNREGSLLSEFECPHVKVSRCCGLKITSEGYVVTLAKNNHHVLVLNTLYIF